MRNALTRSDLVSELSRRGDGIHIKQSAQLWPFIAPVANLNVKDNANAAQASSTTAFFTQMAAAYGAQDTTNWTAATYKTLLSVTGAGFLAAIVGPTAGGAETTTFEITVDGVLDEIAITVAASQRAGLACKLCTATDFTSADVFAAPGVDGTIGSDKATFTLPSNPVQYMLPWRHAVAVPMVRFNRTLLIRAKHSATITNSTATAYSAVQYRLEL